jgi:CRISPR-associated protein Cas1
LEHGVELAILTRTGSRIVGQITSPATKNIELRVEQFKKYGDESFRTALAKIIVRGKISNCINLLRTFSYNHPDINLSPEVEGMQSALAGISDAANINTLMGVEGNAAHIYFGGFSKMILGEFTFAGRKKHPAPDPVNALLSFGYTLFFNEILSLLDGLGFDPYLGYFHNVEYGRASLASDLVEEFRASADRFALYLINDRIFKPADFFTNPKGGGVYLTREAQKPYFVQYERHVNREFVHPDTNEKTTLRKCFRLQAERLAAFIKGDSEYKPFNLEV